MANNTDVSVENNWLHLFDNEAGYEFYLKTFRIGNKKQTVSLDNFSVSCVSLLDYDLDEVDIDLSDWSNIADYPVYEYSDYEEGLNKLKEILNNEDYEDVVSLYKEKLKSE